MTFLSGIYAQKIYIQIVIVWTSYFCIGTVADNIRYGPQLRGKKLSDNEVHKLLALADLDSSLINKPGVELSVGQAQRVALARTLANEPEVRSHSEMIFTLLFSHSSKCDNFITPRKKNIYYYCKGNTMENQLNFVFFCCHNFLCN